MIISYVAISKNLEHQIINKDRNIIRLETEVEKVKNQAALVDSLRLRSEHAENQIGVLNEELVNLRTQLAKKEEILGRLRGINEEKDQE